MKLDGPINAVSMLILFVLGWINVCVLRSPAPLLEKLPLLFFSVVICFGLFFYEAQFVEEEIVEFDEDHVGGDAK